ncbi:hypothetical protein DZB84_20665 [Bacillus sp. HNG]|nr:hypothetical protein DZB84_20665 [Bacillus sp. HNG]
MTFDNGVVVVGEEFDDLTGSVDAISFEPWEYCVLEPQRVSEFFFLEDIKREHPIRTFLLKSRVMKWLFRFF